MFVLDQKHSVCSSCAVELWLLVVQLRHPQHRETSPRQTRAKGVPAELPQLQQQPVGTTAPSEHPKVFEVTENYVSH